MFCIIVITSFRSITSLQFVKIIGTNNNILRLLKIYTLFALNNTYIFKYAIKYVNHVTVYDDKNTTNVSKLYCFYVCHCAFKIIIEWNIFDDTLDFKSYLASVLLYAYKMHYFHEFNIMISKLIKLSSDKHYNDVKLKVIFKGNIMIYIYGYFFKLFNLWN